MPVELGAISGIIELKDEFTGTLGLAEAALSNFTKHNQESLKAIAEAAGLLGAVFTAVGAAIIELGSHGGNVSDVEHALEHFTGSAEAADEVMKKLHDSTLGTVGDFDLAKDAVKLLSTGVKLTADDFGTLGSAAEIMKKRGLVPTAEALELISTALVSGQTRLLARKLGVADVSDAEEKYAAKLGVSKDMLNETGKVEAKRIAIMDLLSRAVKDAGEQHRNFGEQIAAGKIALENWIDDLGQAVAKSPVLAAGMKTIEDALKSAFGGDNAELISQVVSALETAAKGIVYFGIGAVEVARAFYTAWEFVKSLILGIETAIVGAVTLLAGAVTVIATLATKLPGGEIFKGIADSAKDVTKQLAAMTGSLAAQTKEAIDATNGSGAVNAAFDKLSGTLINTVDSMGKATSATAENTKADQVSASNKKKLSDLQVELNKNVLDQQKITDALIKSTRELNGIWDDYYVMVAKDSGTSGDEQRAQIEATFQKQVEALDALDPLYNEKYAAYETIAKRALEHIGQDWSSVRDKSIEGLQEQADAAKRLWEQMQTGGLHFQREVLDEQRKKWEDLRDKARGFGPDVATASEQAAAGLRTVGDEGIKAGDAILDSMGNVTKAVILASGKIVALEDILKGFVTGMFDINGNEVKTLTQDRYSPADFAQGAASLGKGVTADELKQMVVAGYGSLPDIIKLAKDAFEEATRLTILHGQPTAGDAINQWKAIGGSVPGFADGGIVMVGERGPEAVRLPYGSQVYPTNTSPGGMSIVVSPGAVVLNYPVMDAKGKDELGRVVATALEERMRDLGYSVFR